MYICSLGNESVIIYFVFSEISRMLCIAKKTRYNDLIDVIYMLYYVIYNDLIDVICYILYVNLTVILCKQILMLV